MSPALGRISPQRSSRVYLGRATNLTHRAAIGMAKMPPKMKPGIMNRAANSRPGIGLVTDSVD